MCQGFFRDLCAQPSSATTWARACSRSSAPTSRRPSRSSPWRSTSTWCCGPEDGLRVSTRRQRAPAGLPGGAGGDHAAVGLGRDLHGVAHRLRRRRRPVAGRVLRPPGRDVVDDRPLRPDHRPRLRPPPHTGGLGLRPSPGDGPGRDLRRSAGAGDRLLGRGPAAGRVRRRDARRHRRLGGPLLPAGARGRADRDRPDAVPRPGHPARPAPAAAGPQMASAWARAASSSARPRARVRQPAAWAEARRAHLAGGAAQHVDRLVVAHQLGGARRAGSRGRPGRRRPRGPGRRDRAQPLLAHQPLGLRDGGVVPALGGEQRGRPRSAWRSLASRRQRR